VSGRRIVVLLGTDVHPFARLVAWADEWAHDHPEDEVVVQHGYSSPPSEARAVRLLPPAELVSLIARADVVVTHGGPGTMSDARAAGHRPILVPRDPGRGEHVDGHQQRFAAWVEEKGLAAVARDVETFRAAVSATDRGRVTAADSRVVATASKVGELVGELFAGSDPPSGPVLYIAGSGRSGSTLLERMLGQIDGVQTLGEVHHLWERGVGKDELCGCGEPFSHCPFWSAVGDRIGGWRAEDVPDVSRLADRVDRHRRFLHSLVARRGGAHHAAVLRYTARYRAIYDAARAVSGPRLLVDSGKHPTLAACLARDPSIDLRILHLVRDPVGVAFSWSKSVARPEARDEEGAYMTRYSPALSSALWAITTVESELLRWTRRPSVRVRYEDLVRSPRSELERALTALRLPTDGLEQIDTAMVLEPNHTVAGNPMRFRNGEIVLRPDTEWSEKMPRVDRLEVAAMTLPFRAAFGYRDV
jgi:UDP-N-acetylglucosamine transferase subunit ALG13